MLLKEDYFNDLDIKDEDIQQETDMIDDTVIYPSIINDANITYLFELDVDKHFDVNSYNDTNLLDRIEKCVRYALEVTFNIDVGFDYYIESTNPTKNPQYTIKCMNRYMISDRKYYDNDDRHVMICLFIYAKITKQIDLIKSFDVLGASLKNICEKNNNGEDNTELVIMPDFTIFNGLVTPKSLYDVYSGSIKINYANISIDYINMEYYKREKISKINYVMRKLGGYVDCDYNNILKLYKNKCGFNEGDRIMERYAAGRWQYIGSGNRLSHYDEIKKITMARSYTNDSIYQPVNNYYYDNANNYLNSVPDDMDRIMRELSYRVYEYYESMLAIVFDGIHGDTGHNGQFYAIYCNEQFNEKCKLSWYDEDVIFDKVQKSPVIYGYAAVLVAALGSEKARKFVREKHNLK